MEKAFSIIGKRLPRIDVLAKATGEAKYTIDYTRNDALAGKYHWYVLQAPMFNAFFTTEVALN